jgi:hypothetical protein
MQSSIRKRFWMVAGATGLAALTGCSDDPAGGDGGGGGGSSGAAGSATAAGSGGSAGAGGAVATGGSTSKAGATSAGAGGSGPPKANCGNLTCASGEICISKDAFFAGEGADECAQPPDGCPAYNLCDCHASSWNGSPIYGCSAFVPPTLYVYDMSCGDAPCAAGMVCLVDDSETKPPSCVAPPDGCTIDNMFCKGECAKQVATAAGMDYAGCKASSVGVGVTVRPL